MPPLVERSSFKLGQTSPGPALREGMGQGNGTGPGQDELPTKPPAELAPLTDAERAATFFASHGVTEHGGTRFHGVSIPRCQQMLVLALTSLDVAEALAG